MPDPTGIFISYRRIDTNWAAVSLKHHIARHLPGAPVFMDIESIEPGQDFVEAINHNVDQCRILLAVIGPNWLTVSDNAGRRRLDNPDDFVRLEITRALERGIRLIPLLVDNATMPPGDVMPDPLKPLSRRNAVTVNQHSHTRDFDVVTEFLDKAFPDLASAGARTAAPVPVAATPPPPPHDIGAEIAQALVDAGTDPKTMLSVAQMRHEAGQHRIELAIRRAAQPLLETSEGAESDWALSNRHNHALALLNLGRSAEAEQACRELIPILERVQGPEHSGTLITRRSWARAALETGRADVARQALAPIPADGGDPDPMRNGQTAMWRGWLADLDGDAGGATALLDRAETHLAHLDPAHYARRELAKYRDTRVPGGAGGTTLWALDR